LDHLLSIVEIGPIMGEPGHCVNFLVKLCRRFNQKFT
jgi:hypothetical protein